MSSLYDPGGLKLPSCSASPGYPGIDLHTVSTSEAETVESTDELPSEANAGMGTPLVHLILGFTIGGFKNRK